MEILKSPRVSNAKTALNAVFKAVLAVSVVCLVFSLMIEIWGDLKACWLCSMQRYVYGLLIGLCILGCFHFREEAVRKVLLLVLGLGFLFAMYHSLLYFGLIETKCETLAGKVLDLSTFKKNLNRPKNCSDQMLMIFGIPGSLLNIVIYLLSLYFVCRGSLLSPLAKN